MEPAQSLDPDPFDFQEVEPLPPDRTEEAAPEEARDGSQEDLAGASPDSVPDTRRVSVGDWRRALLKTDELGATAQHVALVLAEYMDRDGGGAWPSHATLAAVCHRGERSVRDALNAIEAAGFVHVHRRPGRVSTYLATVPDGGEVIDHPGSLRPRQSETPAVSTGLVRQSQHPHPGSLSTTTQPSTQPSTQERAAPSLTDDPELYSAMLALAEANKARSPKAWAAKVYGDDILPIIKEQGREAALDEINHRWNNSFGGYHPPSRGGHDDAEQHGFTTMKGAS